MLCFGRPVRGKAAAKFGIGRQVRGIKIQAVSRSGGAGDAVIAKVHPGRFRVGLHGFHVVSQGRCLHLQIYYIAIEAQGVTACAIIGSGVVVRPGILLQIAFISPAVTHNAPMDPLDAGFLEKGFPLPEKSVGFKGDGVFGTQRRVSSADDVQVSLERTVVQDGAGVTQAGGVTVLRAQRVEGGAGCNQFHVGSGNHPLPGIVFQEGVSIGIPRHYAPYGAFQGAASRLPLDIFLCRGLRGRGQERQQSRYGKDSSHYLQNYAFFRINSAKGVNNGSFNGLYLYI